MRPAVRSLAQGGALAAMLASCTRVGGSLVVGETRLVPTGCSTDGDHRVEVVLVDGTGRAWSMHVSSAPDELLLSHDDVRYDLRDATCRKLAGIIRKSAAHVDPT